MSNFAPLPMVSFVIPLYFTGSGIDRILASFQDLPVDGGYNGLGPEGLGQNTKIAGSR